MCKIFTTSEISVPLLRDVFKKPSSKIFEVLKLPKLMSGSWVSFYEITIVSRIYVAEKVEVE